MVFGRRMPNSGQDVVASVECIKVPKTSDETAE